MSAVDLAKLPDYLKAQRWFAGKAWPITHVNIVDHVDFVAEGCELALAVVEVTYKLGHPDRYLLPVAPTRGGEIREALDTDACLRALFGAIREGRTVTGGGGRVVGEWIPEAAQGLTLPRDVSVRRLNVEQSNTSVVLGEQLILKVIRKLEAGVNPEYEMGRFLATKTKFRATPQLVGALQLEGPAGATLAVVHRYVPNATDGWKHTLGVFRSGRAPDRAFLDEMRQLGQRLGELHVALAAGTDDPAFAPEDVLPEDVQRWSASLVGELGVTLAQASGVDPRLEGKREELVRLAQSLAHVAPSGKKIRIHGDLHLGQVLRAGGDWLIFDFEGEPGRTFAQRREKYSALRDVAGMLRSFDYASATVALEGGGEAPSIQPAREAFLAGYREAARSGNFLPRTDEAFQTALTALELEKLLYEVRYELQNRPDWVRIPVSALLRMEGPK